MIDAQDGVLRLTLITCNDWDLEVQIYNQRVILIAEPVEGTCTEKERLLSCSK